MPASKKKRPAVSAQSSEDESRAEVVKTPKSTKKQKVIQEKETRKTQKVIHHFYSSLTTTHNVLFLWEQIELFYSLLI